MIDNKLLARASLTGMTLEGILSVLGAISPWVRDNVLLFGFMLLAGLAGLLYARDAARGYGPGALGGLIAGVLSGAMGVATALALHAPQPFMPVVGCVVAGITGLAGGLFGQMGANQRAAVARKERRD